MLNRNYAYLLSVISALCCLPTVAHAGFSLALTPRISVPVGSESDLFSAGQGVALGVGYAARLGPLELTPAIAGHLEHFAKRETTSPGLHSSGTLYGAAAVLQISYVARIVPYARLDLGYALHGVSSVPASEDGIGVGATNGGLLFEASFGATYPITSWLRFGVHGGYGRLAADASLQWIHTGFVAQLAL